MQQQRWFHSPSLQLIYVFSITNENEARYKSWPKELFFAISRTSNLYTLSNILHLHDTSQIYLDARLYCRYFFLCNNLLLTIPDILEGIVYYTIANSNRQNINLNFSINSSFKNGRYQDVFYPFCRYDFSRPDERKRWILKTNMNVLKKWEINSIIWSA